jgi:replicative DNA helicase
VNNDRGILPPHDDDAERAVLGSIMHDPDAIDRVNDILAGGRAFYTPRHRTIYDAMMQAYGQGKPPDLTVVVSTLTDRRELRQAGGRTYIAEIHEGFFIPSRVEHYADIVADKYSRREVYRHNSIAIENALDCDKPLDETVNDLETGLMAATRNTDKTALVGASDALTEAINQVEAYQAGDVSDFVVATGFHQLDRLLEIKNTDLVVLAARPSVGKSALALNIAQRVAANGKPVLYFTLEMSADQLAGRMLCAEAMVPRQEIRRGRLSVEAMNSLHDAETKLAQLPLTIYDRGGVSLSELRSVARREIARVGAGFIVIDYLQLMAIDGHDGSTNDKVAAVSRGCKALTKELHVPILLLSQLSRQVEMRQFKVPQLSDLRDSGAIEQDADSVLFIYRPDIYIDTGTMKVKDEFRDSWRNKANLIVAKQRGGPIGNVMMAFEKKYAQFSEIDWVHKDQPEMEMEL